jgi:Tfp pilus assembly protein PilF
MRLTPQPSFEALVVGVKISRARNDSGSEQSYLQQLRRRYPDAPELQQLLEKRP